jgi:hypothetical protein
MQKMMKVLKVSCINCTFQSIMLVSAILVSIYMILYWTMWALGYITYVIFICLKIEREKKKWFSTFEKNKCCLLESVRKSGFLFHFMFHLHDLITNVMFFFFILFGIFIYISTQSISFRWSKRELVYLPFFMLHIVEYRVRVTYSFFTSKKTKKWKIAHWTIECKITQCKLKID